MCVWSDNASSPFQSGTLSVPATFGVTNGKKANVEWPLKPSDDPSESPVSKFSFVRGLVDVLGLQVIWLKMLRQTHRPIIRIDLVKRLRKNVINNRLIISLC